MELSAQERLLGETLENWKIYEASYDPLDRWLAEGEQMQRRSGDEKQVSSIKPFCLEINHVNRMCIAKISSFSFLIELFHTNQSLGTCA